MKNILSIDGGGIRGIIPAMVLVRLESMLQQATHNPDARIAEYFDFIAGTSSGGILTTILLYPDEKNPSKPKYSAKDALNLLIDHGPEIFKASSWRKFLSQFGLVTELYNPHKLNEILQHYLGDVKLSQLIKPCVFTAYHIELRKNHLFRQQKAILKGEIRDFYLRDICRATSAAPTFFPVAEIYSLSNTRYPLIDGGVFAQNPSIAAMIEVLKAFNTTQINDLFITSLGTGMNATSYNYNDFKKKWAIQIGPSLVDIMTSASSESTEYYIRQLFLFNGKEKDYIRIEPENMLSIDPKLDAANDENMKKLIALADQMISLNENNLNRIIQIIITDPPDKKKKSVWNRLMNKF